MRRPFIEIKNTLTWKLSATWRGSCICSAPTWGFAVAVVGTVSRSCCCASVSWSWSAPCLIYVWTSIVIWVATTTWWVYGCLSCRSISSTSWASICRSVVVIWINSRISVCTTISFSWIYICISICTTIPFYWVCSCISVCSCTAVCSCTSVCWSISVRFINRCIAACATVPCSGLRTINSYCIIANSGASSWGTVVIAFEFMNCCPSTGSSFEITAARAAVVAIVVIYVSVIYNCCTVIYCRSVSVVISVHISMIHSFMW